MERFLSKGIILAVLFAALGIANADTMQSSNYRLEQDSINAGGLRSGSSNYTIEDTVGEQATGRSGSTSYNIKAGYQQMQEVGLSLSGAANVTLSPALQTTGGGTSDGSLALTAATDNQTGYQLSIAAANAPAMQATGGAFIPNYAPAGSNPDFSFTVGAGASAFGFSPEGTHIVGKYKDNGSVCGTGALDTTNSCWNALSTTDEIIATSTTANNPNGTVTTLRFRVEADSAATLTAGSYIATTTVTLIAL